MKKSQICLSIIFAAFTSFTAAAATGCKAKKQDIQQELSMARQHRNSERIAGLEKALREANEHCTDAGLQQARQEKMAEKQQKVQKREQDLHEAQASGRSDKIEKQQRKLADARAELQEAQNALTQ